MKISKGKKGKGFALKDLPYAGNGCVWFQNRVLHRTDEYANKIANSDMTAYQYYTVALRSDGKVELCDSTSDIVYGVLQNAPDSGEVASIKVAGESKVVLAAGVSFANGNFVGPSSSGTAQVAVTGQYPFGVIVGGGDSTAELAVVDLFRSGVAIA